MRTGGATRAVTVAALACAMATSSCDDAQAWHRLHPTLERMLDQQRADPFAPNETFADGRAMRTPPAGTLARGSEDSSFASPDGGFVDRIPLPLTRALLERGRSEFEVTCAACHGILGDSTSIVATKMEQRPPPSLHLDRIRVLPVGEIEEVIEVGYGLMPSYAPQLPTAEERWAVVAYVRALQESQHAEVAALPLQDREALARIPWGTPPTPREAP